LVVEDEPTVGQLISDVLREDGHHVDAVLDGQEGLARLSKANYHLVICDLRMARLDGQAFYDALAGVGSNLRDRIILVEELKLAVNHALDGHARRDSSPPGNLR
jgi:CheY-like chemotaxis protein